MSCLNNILLKNLNLKNSKIIYCDFEIELNKPFEEQKWSYKEDLLQIGSGVYLIDIGWYPEFRKNGSFSIKIIKSYKWDKPFFEKRTKSLIRLKKYLQEAIDFCASKEIRK